MVQVPVEDPRLPDGPLERVARWSSFGLYIDASSWEPSDLPDLVRGTAVLVAPESPGTLQVILIWVDCRRQVYQLSQGRAYDASGVEIAATTYVPDQPVGDGGPMKQLADRVCAASGSPPGPVSSVADWRRALEETRAPIPPTP